MRSFLRFYPLFHTLLLVAPLAIHAEPEWIWSSKQAKPNEKAVFRKTFTTVGQIKSATLTLTCDNGATAFLNGRSAAQNENWNQPVKADVTKLLKAGENEFRIEGRNENGIAALIATLAVETVDGKKQLVETGADWQVAALGSTDFKAVTVIAKYGAAPWGAVFS